MYPRFFNAADLGRSLHEVGAEHMSQGSHQVTSRWFHSSKDCDLFIWTDAERNVLKQQLSFFGQVVEWNAVEGLRTGVVIEFEREQGRISSSETVHFDEKPQSTPVVQAIDLLEHMTVLNDLERHRLKSNFSNPGLGITMSEAEFVRRFGEILQPLHFRPAVTESDLLAPLWRRAMRLIKRWFGF